MAVTKRTSGKKKVSRLKKLGRIFNPRSLKGGMALFALVFAVSGAGYFAYRSFASTVLTTSMVKTVDNKGYYLLEVNGGLLHYGSAVHRGSPHKDGVTGQTFVDMALTSSGAGYWILAESGRVYNYGDASKITVSASVGSYVAIVPTPGQGFWLVNKLGTAIAYGDATTTYKLDTTKKNYVDGGYGTVKDVKGIVDADVMNTGLGLYMLDSNGKVYTVGAAVDRGGAESLLQAGESAISIASAGSSASYIITTNLGKIIPKGGDVTFRGGKSDTALPSPISHIAKMGHLTDNSDGYWLVTFSGQVHKFGSAAFYGDSSAKELTQVYVPPPDPCKGDIVNNILQLQKCLNSKGASPKLVENGILETKTRQACADIFKGYCPHNPIVTAENPGARGCPATANPSLCNIQVKLNIEIAKPGGIDIKLTEDGLWGEKTKAACTAYKAQVPACNSYLINPPSSECPSGQTGYPNCHPATWVRCTDGAYAPSANECGSPPPPSSLKGLIARTNIKFEKANKTRFNGTFQSCVYYRTLNDNTQKSITFSEFTFGGGTKTKRFKKVASLPTKASGGYVCGHVLDAKCYVNSYDLDHPDCGQYTIKSAKQSITTSGSVGITNVVGRTTTLNEAILYTTDTTVRWEN